MNDNDGFLLGALLAFMMCAAIWSIQFQINRYMWRQEINKHGYAQYTTDPTTGVTTWDWKK